MNKWNHKNFEVFESDINGRKNQTWGSCGGDQTNKKVGIDLMNLVSEVMTSRHMNYHQRNYLPLGVVIH